MPKVVPYELDAGGGRSERGWRFWCPGCCQPHMLCTEPAGPLRPNGTRSHVWRSVDPRDLSHPAPVDPERPTFEPSLHYQHHRGNWGDTDEQGRTTWVPEGEPITDCHLKLTAGRIAYLGDCPHEFAGQTVDCPDWPETEDDRDRLRHMPSWMFRDPHTRRRRGHLARIRHAYVVSRVALRVRSRGRG